MLLDHFVTVASATRNLRHSLDPKRRWKANWDFDEIDLDNSHHGNARHLLSQKLNAASPFPPRILLTNLHLGRDLNSVQPNAC